MPERVALIVDDDPAFGATLANALKGKPVRVEFATSASAAIEMLSTRSYCGLVLDLVLNDGSGFDVLRHLERSNVTIPTVIVSQKLPAYVREMLDQEYVKLVFPKPVEPHLLASVVLGLCGIQIE